MKSWFPLFNCFLVLALAIVPLGCQSAGGAGKKQKKEDATLRIYMEVNYDGSSRNKLAEIMRDNPVRINVESVPVLNESHVSNATVTDAVGGFSLEIKFTDRGTRILEMATTANRGQRLAIYSDFDHSSRWLGAPLISRQITNGVLVFTPDATREEAESIARGLNRVAAQVKKRDKF